MIRQPSRLHRAIPHNTGEGVFEVRAEDLLLRDDQIASISINRGGGLVGVHPSTVTVTSTSSVPLLDASNLRIELSPSAAGGIGDRVTMDPDLFIGRFRGRVGKQAVTDHGNRLTYDTMAAGFLASMQSDPTRHTLYAGTYVRECIETLARPGRYGFEMITRGATDVLHEHQGSLSYSDGIGMFTEDIGIYLQDRRDGDIEIQTWEYRKALAEDLADSRYAIGRSQVLAPASWEQPTEGDPIDYFMRYRQADGTTRTIYTAPGNEPRPGRPLSDLVDWTYLRFETDQWRYIYGMQVQAGDWYWRLPALEFDMIGLLASDRYYDRVIAGYLLTLEVGDPITLGGDWPPFLRGAHYTTSIDETITGSAWRISIGLQPYRELTGTNSPPVIARVWDQATYSWNSETRTWDSA